MIEWEPASLNASFMYKRQPSAETQLTAAVAALGVLSSATSRAGGNATIFDARVVTWISAPIISPIEKNNVRSSLVAGEVTENPAPTGTVCRSLNPVDVLSIRATTPLLRFST